MPLRNQRMHPGLAERSSKMYILPTPTHLEVVALGDSSNISPDQHLNYALIPFLPFLHLPVFFSLGTQPPTHSPLGVAGGAGVGERDPPGEEGRDQLHHIGVAEAGSDEKTSRTINWFVLARRTWAPGSSATSRSTAACSRPPSRPGRRNHRLVESHFLGCPQMLR